MKKGNNHLTFTKIILDSITEGVFTVDNDWYVTSFNHAAEKITGVKADSAIGMKCYDVFRANICQTKCALSETLRTGKNIIGLPVNILDKNGQNIPVVINTALLKDEHGNILGGVETFRDITVIENLKKEISQKYSVEDIISKHHAILKLFEILPTIAKSDSTVLIQGESGTGKELFARAIHNLSKRTEEPFIAINCGALPENLLESELFGYKKGAFTDAKQDKPGRFALAEGGTLFLDEVSDFSPLLQAKLLRILQEREYEPLGATATQKTDVRIVAATNQDLAEMVKQKAFREDLYYRLNIINIELPPLRRRKEDTPLLVNHFIKKLNIKTEKEIRNVSDDVMRLFMSYDFPGNIRELENLIEHAFVMCGKEQIEIEHLPKKFTETVMVESMTRPSTLHQHFQKSEEEIIKEALQRNLWKRSSTARELGIHPVTLWRKMKQIGLL